MRSFSLLALVALAACGGATTSQADPNSADIVQAEPAAEVRPTLRVLTFNLRHDRDYWKERFDLIAKELASLKPHIIGAQEVEVAVDQTRALADRLAMMEGSPNYYVFERLKHGPDAKRGEGIAIYSQYPFVQTDWRKLSHGRLILFGRLALPGGVELDVYNTHLHDKGGDRLRARQVRTALSWIAENSQGREVLLVGDFNADPESEPIRLVRESFVDAHAKANPGSSGFTTPVVLSKDTPEQALERRIDFVFYKIPEHAWKLQKTENVMEEANAAGLMPSDHLGVMATFEARAAD